MAAGDYTVRSLTLGFCPTAVLAENISALVGSVLISGYTSPIPDGIVIGRAAMIGGEIVSILGVAGSVLTIGRGCCDTVPAPHLTGDRIWFFDDSIGSTGVEYAGNETIGVKVLPRTMSGGAVPVASAPPNGITFNWRFVRPYPPGLVLVNGQPFTSVLRMEDGTPSLTLSWAHRDRLTQQDQLIAHAAASIGPEIGVTYKARVFKADNTLVRTVTGIAGTSWVYDWSTAVSDFESAGGLPAGYIRLTAERDGFESFQDYRIDFDFDGTGPLQPYGLGYRLGESLGGVTP